MLIILFGLAGSGKNYVGNKLKELGCIFWDADEALTDEMKQCVAQKISFAQTMRDQFCLIIIEKIRLLQAAHPNQPLVIGQALYKESNRQQIAAAYPEAFFIEVQAPLEIIQQRLKARGNAVTQDYAAQISKNYEPATLPHCKIINDSKDEKELMVQLKKLINKDPEQKTGCASATGINLPLDGYSLFSVALPLIRLNPSTEDPAKQADAGESKIIKKK